MYGGTTATHYSNKFSTTTLTCGCQSQGVTCGCNGLRWTTTIYVVSSSASTPAT